MEKELTMDGAFRLATAILEMTYYDYKQALKYLNKPFINVVWDASIQESESLIAGKTKSNVWMAYIKNIAMVNYIGLTYFDSDFYKIPVIYDDEKTPENQIGDQEIPPSDTTFINVF